MGCKKKKKDCTSPNFDCLKRKFVTLWSEFFPWFLPLVLYLCGNSKSRFIYYNYLFQMSGIFFVWENYKFIDFYTIPHSFYLFTLLYGKILSWRYVCKYIIYIHMQLYHAKYVILCYAILYIKNHSNLPHFGPSPITLSLFLCFLKKLI